jgi:adenosine deaminase CECR1
MFSGAARLPAPGPSVVLPAMLRPAVFSLLFSVVSAVHAADFGGRFEELKRTLSPAQLYALLYDLPKGGDLHNHSGGSEIPEWIYDVLTNPERTGGDTFYTRARISTEPTALAAGVRFRTIRQRTYDQLSPVIRAEYVPLAKLSPAEKTAWLDAFRLDAPGEGRNEFFNGIWARRGDIGQNLQVRLELLAENIKAFAAEGVRYLETQFSADSAITVDGRVIPPEEAAAAIRQRLAGADIVATGLTVRLQDTVLRFRPDAEAKLAETYAFVDANRDLWVGLNMAGIEENGRGYPRRFLPTFRQLRSLYPTLPLSIHAGEMDGPDSHVRDTLLLGATRIGHGINLIHDENTLLLLQQHRRVLVEVNLISNRLLEYTPDLTQHPFPEYLRTGVPVCLNTDDRGMWDSNLTDEYYTAVTTFRLSWTEVVALGRNSLAHAFVQPDVKAKLLADYDARVAAFEEKYGAGTITDALAKVQVVRPVAYGYARRTWGFDFR